HGNIWGGNANGVAGQLAFEFWQCLGHGLRCTGLGQNHVQTSSATTAVALVVVVNQDLGIGKGVCGFHVAVDYTVAVIDDLENRGNAVGGTRCSGENLVFCRHILVVDGVDKVLHIALTRCGKQHVGNALRLEVLAQALTVAPDTGVVHQNSMVNAIGSVINICLIVGIDILELVSICSDYFVFFILFDGTVECPMNGVTAQQGCTLVNVLIALLTYHDGTQAHAAVGSFARNQNAGKQTADAAKAVKDNIAGLV